MASLADLLSALEALKLPLQVQTISLHLVNTQPLTISAHLQ